MATYIQVVKDYAYSRITVDEAKRALPELRVYTDAEADAKLRRSWSAHLSTKGGLT